MLSNHQREDWKWYGAPSRLRAWATLLLCSSVFAIGIPLGLWSGLSDPRMMEGVAGNLTRSETLTIAATLASTLILIPIIWVCISGVLDTFAFFCVLFAMDSIGFFYIGITAWKNGPSLGYGVIREAPLVMLINGVGTLALFIVLGSTYYICTVTGLKILPLRAPPEEYDLRLKWILRALGLVTVGLLAAPMISTHSVPFLVNDLDARMVLYETDSLRAFYNLGYSLMPYVAAGLVIFYTRKPMHFLGIDGMIAGLLFITQLLSGNRGPLAIAIFVTITLFTLERRFSRPMLIVLFAGIILLFTFLSGLSGLYRTDRDALKNGAVMKSIEAAYTGDNLIEVRDAAWVLSQWNFEPLMGTTYLGALTSMLPSGLFPQKKEWHLGRTCIRIVGWENTSHFGLRVTTFGEAFLNFGLAGAIMLGSILGIIFGTLLRALHQAAEKRPPCLHYNMKLIILMMMCTCLADTGAFFSTWVDLALLIILWLGVDCCLSNRALSHLTSDR